MMGNEYDDHAAPEWTVRVVRLPHENAYGFIIEGAGERAIPVGKFKVAAEIVEAAQGKWHPPWTPYQRRIFAALDAAAEVMADIDSTHNKEATDEPQDPENAHQTDHA